MSLTPCRFTERTGIRARHHPTLAPEIRTCPRCGQRVLHVALKLNGTLLDTVFIQLNHCPRCGDQSEDVLRTWGDGFHRRSGHKCRCAPQRQKHFDSTAKVNR